MLSESQPTIRMCITRGFITISLNLKHFHAISQNEFFLLCANPPAQHQWAIMATMRSVQQWKGKEMANWFLNNPIVVFNQFCYFFYFDIFDFIISFLLLLLFLIIMKIHIIWEIFFGNEILVYINNQYEKKFIIMMHHIRESQPASQPYTQFISFRTKVYKQSDWVQTRSVSAVFAGLSLTPACGLTWTLSVHLPLHPRSLLLLVFADSDSASASDVRRLMGMGNGLVGGSAADRCLHTRSIGDEERNGINKQEIKLC